MNTEKVFPLIEHNWNNSTESYVPELFGGLTKRELFAAMLMQGITSNATTRSTPQDVAQVSVAAADALLAALAK